MRMLLIAGIGLAAAGCVSGPNTAPPAAVAADEASALLDRLPPQSLAPGRCGLFLFAVAEPHAFLVFEDETGRRASILHDGQVHEMGVTAQDNSFAPGDRFRRVYLDQTSGRVFTLTGRVGEETGSGPRLEAALLRVRELDGLEVVTPVSGVRSCRPRAGAS